MACTFSKLAKVKALEKDLLTVKYCVKVDFDLSGLSNNCSRVVILPYYDIKASDPKYRTKLEHFTENIKVVCYKHNLRMTTDRIIDNSICLYMVFEGFGDPWRTAVSSNLPEICFTVDKSSGELRKIVRGIDGYFVACLQLKTKELNVQKANKLNADMGVTIKQVAAMEFGSTYGWDSPGADPKHYTVSGKPITTIL